MNAVIGNRVPNFAASEWVQGEPTNFDQELDHIVLLEVFQDQLSGLLFAWDTRGNQHSQQVQG